MSSQQFLWMSALLAIAFAILFLFPRNKQGPSRLRMFGGMKGRNVPARKVDLGGMSRETRQAASGDVRMKTLNVMFNYNGHSWDAHEVLGVPAGAPMEMVKAAYQKSLSSTDSSSHDFITTAYKAICNEVKS